MKFNKNKIPIAFSKLNFSFEALYLRLLVTQVPPRTADVKNFR